jgi:uncharacterized protein
MKNFILLTPLFLLFLLSCAVAKGPEPANDPTTADANMVITVDVSQSRAISSGEADVVGMDLDIKNADGGQTIASKHWEKTVSVNSFSFCLELNKNYRLDVTHYYYDADNAMKSAADAPYPFSVKPGRVTLIKVIPGGIAVIDVPPEGSNGLRISGTIRRDGAPLAAVAVSLEGTASSTQTDSNGYFEFGGLDPGAYALLTSKTGVTIIPDSYSRKVELVDHDATSRNFSAFDFNAAYINAIQGRGHLSSFNGQTVSSLIGVVTLVDAKQFTMQNPDPDSDSSTSEGILVYLNAVPQVAVGDWVSVSGTVSEYYPNGASYGGLSVTEIKSPSVSLLSRGHALPAPVVIGTGGRVPPNAVICDDAVSGIVDASPFDPENDGIDFYESLEFMRVQINDGRVVNPTIFYSSSDYRETYLLGDDGANATGLTARGGIGISENDFNPEIIAINDKFKPYLVDAQVNDRFPGAIVGVLDYTYGIFKIFATETIPTLVPGSLPKETTNLSGTGSKLTVASFNTENISPADPALKFERCADAIVNAMESPDIIVICEVQDDNGPAAGGTGASATWNAIIAAVSAKGGPAYLYREIAPENNADGGAPDGNIRQGFLFNPARAEFIDRPGGDANAATTVSNDGGSASISFSPGRIDPANSAFADSRKPLVGEFSFQGRKVYVIGNHLNSKGGDAPLWGRSQPPLLASETQRLAQAQAIAGFVGQILAIEPNANIVIGGDLNDFEFSRPIRALLGANLRDLVDDVPKADRYTYLYSGNSQVLDHLIVSESMYAKNPEIDIVHIDAEYPDALRVSDHDPLVARFTF